MNHNIKAVTFDLWDTIVHDDSDEPKRKAKGLRSKRAERRHLLWEALNRHAPIAEAEVTLAYDVADAAFNRVWHQQHVTWRIGERLEVALKGLGRSLPAEDFAELVRPRVAEVHQHPIAHVPGDKAVEAGDRVGDAAMIPADDLAQVLGIQARRQRR